ncbi:MAG: tyrosinase family protein [Planctomycetota bacterium]
MATLSLEVFGQAGPRAGYIAWTPVPLVIRNPDQVTGSLLLTNESSAGSITRVSFFEEVGGAPNDEMTVVLDGSPDTTIWVAGKFQEGEKHHGASPESKDVTIRAAFVNDPGTEVAQLPLMVRVRRNANELSAQARNDFLKALGELNGIQESPGGPGAGNGIYTTDFVKMHVEGATVSEHGDSMFLPWHRLYLLDLERQLQSIIPEVTLPYWRFDQPAPNVFTEDFMGKMQLIPRDISLPGGELDTGGSNTPPAIFAVDNPLSKWQIENTSGIPRTARFDPETEPANGLSDSTVGSEFDFALRSQNQTLTLGGGTVDPDEAFFGDRIVQGNRFVQTGFSRMEGSPHGAAHMSFNGYINDVPIAPQDPLFFLLHCNVDRLWALWQFAFDRDESSAEKTYPYQNSGDALPWKLVGSTQWPWDGSGSVPDGLAPPGTRQNNFTESIQVQNFPSNAPRIEDSIDPFGQRADESFLGFAYDDPPFLHKPATVVTT